MADLVLLLRGGLDSPEKLMRQATDLERRFTYAGLPVRGISMFAAAGAGDEQRVLDAKLPTYPKYRRVLAARVVEFALLLPTFLAPHWTMLLRRPNEPVSIEDSVIAQFLDAVGPVLDNPGYRPRGARR